MDGPGSAVRPRLLIRLCKKFLKFSSLSSSVADSAAGILWLHGRRVPEKGAIDKEDKKFGHQGFALWQGALSSRS